MPLAVSGKLVATLQGGSGHGQIKGVRDRVRKRITAGLLKSVCPSRSPGFESS